MFKEIPIDNKPVKEKKVNYEQILKLRILPTDDIPKPEAVLFFHQVYARNDHKQYCSL